MKFYTFHQNNSGGVFDHDAISGIGYNVCIEAESVADANDRAENIGLYFNGCDDERDCPCCGDRWYSASEYDAAETPQQYGEPLRAGWGIPSYIHYANGEVETVTEGLDTL